MIVKKTRYRNRELIRNGEHYLNYKTNREKKTRTLENNLWENLKRIENIERVIEKRTVCWAKKRRKIDKYNIEIKTFSKETHSGVPRHQFISRMLYQFILVCVFVWNSCNFRSIFPIALKKLLVTVCLCD